MDKTCRPTKAYFNEEFISSPDARVVRIMCEFLEPKRRLKRHDIKDTIVFFGSARVKPTAKALAELEEMKKRESGSKGKDREALRGKIREQEKVLKLCRYYDDACELSRLLTSWSLGLSKSKRRFIVCSGGGGGIMEAANKGANLAGGKTIGFNISLPHEQMPNPYITDDLNFEFHYFFIRKFWFVYLAKALVIFPGGFGTMDELMEVLTLIQTEKVKKKIPVLVYGPEYWKQIINFDVMLKWGAIDEKDAGLLKFASTPKEAFNYLSRELARIYL